MFSSCVQYGVLGVLGVSGIVAMFGIGLILLSLSGHGPTAKATPIDDFE